MQKRTYSLFQKCCILGYHLWIFRCSVSCEDTNHILVIIPPESLLPFIIVMWTWVSQVIQRSFTASLISSYFSSWNIYHRDGGGGCVLGICRRDMIYLWGKDGAGKAGVHTRWDPNPWSVRSLLLSVKQKWWSALTGKHTDIKGGYVSCVHT